MTGPLVALIFTLCREKLLLIPRVVELLAVRFIVSEKPLRPVNVIAEIPSAPALIERDVGAALGAKFGDGTVTVTLKPWERGPVTPTVAPVTLML